MHANEYQRLAARTLIDKPDFELTPSETMLVWNALGAAGEAGELADLVKKSVFHRKPLDRERFQKEIGDVLWYCAALCTGAGLSLADVMELNVNKLRARYPEGWDASRSHDPGATPIEEKR